jgi:hypothetical protein
MPIGARRSAFAPSRSLSREAISQWCRHKSRHHVHLHAPTERPPINFLISPGAARVVLALPWNGAAGGRGSRSTGRRCSREETAEALPVLLFRTREPLVNDVPSLSFSRQGRHVVCSWRPAPAHFTHRARLCRSTPCNPGFVITPVNQIIYSKYCG